MPGLSQAHLQRRYGPLIAAFIGVAVLVLAGTIYLATSSTTIAVTPSVRALRESIPLTIGPAVDDMADRLAGTVDVESKSETVTVTPSGDGAEVQAHARGTMTIKNETGSPQPLAAGTRLRAENGQIVRTQSRVDVPARGQVTSEVAADALGADGNLPPGRFVIVALWPGLQDKIYGQTSEALAGGTVRAGSTLSLDELTKASNEAEEKIRAAFGSSEPGTMKILSPESVVSEPKSEVPSASYRVTVTMKAMTITYDQAGLDAILRERLTRQLAENEELRSASAADIKTGDQPSSAEVAVIVATEGSAALRPDSPLLAPKEFVSLDRTAISTKLLGSNLVKNVDIIFSPSWRRQAPDQPDRITVTYVQPTE